MNSGRVFEKRGRKICDEFEQHYSGLCMSNLLFQEAGGFAVRLEGVRARREH
jgi:hypothetical protein